MKNNFYNKRNNMKNLASIAGQRMVKTTIPKITAAHQKRYKGNFLRSSMENELS